MKTRNIIELIDAKPASDGDGVNLLRVFSGPRAERFDPFLMLDEFGSNKADDYIGGFPAHPHRGFETVTYMLKGKIEHRDHLGNIGLLGDGGVQWMTAGRGVIHSEMPKQTHGKMHGFQLWVNLPAAKKMQAASYNDVPAQAIPHYEKTGYSAKVISGAFTVNNEVLKGYFDIEDTEPSYADVTLAPRSSMTLTTPTTHTLLVYVYEGEVNAGSTIKTHQLARFDQGETLRLENIGTRHAQFMLLTGKPLDEPIKQYGPFVMNTAEEIDQAIRDYQAGELV